MSQKKLILEYYRNHPNKDVEHADVVDWATKTWLERHGKPFRDPDRAIRMLYQEGILMKIKKGVYRYEPDAVNQRELQDFTPEQKKEILKRGNYKCAVCGISEKEGAELHVDHLRPKDKGGKAEIENGQVLCSKHNFQKKNYSQTESGKKMFKNLLTLARKEGDQAMINFCEDVLKMYDKHDINGHIEWR